MRGLAAGIERYGLNPTRAEEPLFAFHCGKWCAKLHFKKSLLAATYTVCLDFRCRSPKFLLVFATELL